MLLYSLLQCGCQIQSTNLDWKCHATLLEPHRLIHLHKGTERSITAWHNMTALVTVCQHAPVQPKSKHRSADCNKMPNAQAAAALDAAAEGLAAGTLHKHVSPPLTPFKCICHAPQLMLKCCLTHSSAVNQAVNSNCQDEQLHRKVATCIQHAM